MFWSEESKLKEYNQRKWWNGFHIKPKCTKIIQTENDENGFHTNINVLNMLIKCIRFKNLVIKQGLKKRENLF